MTSRWVSASLVAVVTPLLAQQPVMNRLAPAVPSPQNVVEKMLEAAKLKPGETVYDLGSGDGRVLVTAAQRFGAKAVGIEISPREVQASQERIKTLKLENRIQVIQGDLMTADISGADVVTLYLLTASNDLLRPHLEKSLKPGTRVVCHDYPIRGWNPVTVEEIDAHRRPHKIYVYEIRAKK